LIRDQEGTDIAGFQILSKTEQTILDKTGKKIGQIKTSEGISFAGNGRATAVTDPKDAVPVYKVVKEYAEGGPDSTFYRFNTRYVDPNQADPNNPAAGVFKQYTGGAGGQFQTAVEIRDDKGVVIGTKDYKVSFEIANETSAPDNVNKIAIFIKRQSGNEVVHTVMTFSPPAPEGGDPENEFARLENTIKNLSQIISGQATNTGTIDVLTMLQLLSQTSSASDEAKSVSYQASNQFMEEFANYFDIFPEKKILKGD
jgi:hypothetical protein